MLGRLPFLWLGTPQLLLCLPLSELLRVFFLFKAFKRGYVCWDPAIQPGSRKGNSIYDKIGVLKRNILLVGYIDIRTLHMTRGHFIRGHTVSSLSSNGYLRTGCDAYLRVQHVKGMWCEKKCYWPPTRQLGDSFSQLEVVWPIVAKFCSLQLGELPRERKLCFPTYR